MAISGYLQPVDVSPDRRDRRYRHRAKRCYELAGRYQTNHPDVILVHAPQHGWNNVMPIHHAWCELPEGLVYEPYDGKFYGLAAYRAARQPADDEQRYTRTQAAQLIGSTGTWGPWA